MSSGIFLSGTLSMFFAKIFQTFLRLCHYLFSFCSQCSPLSSWVFYYIWLESEISKVLYARKFYDNFSERPRDVEILVGTNKLCSGGTRYSTNKTFIHDNYTKSNYAYDIALIRVQSPIEFNSKVQPIKISPKVIEPETQLKVTGWGYITVIVLELNDKFCCKKNSINFNIQRSTAKILITYKSCM